MKRLTLAVSTFAIVGLLAVPALAGNGTPSGKHHNVNIIGVPKDEGSNFLGGNADSSNGSTLFIPVKTSKRPKNSELRDGETFCTELDSGLQTTFEDEDGPTFLTEEPDGRTRIYFDPTYDGSFGITDRDAIDGEGRIDIPVETETNNDGDLIEKEVLVDMYVRVLGPRGCAELSGYAYEDPNDGGINPIELWWYSGSILVNRKPGRSTWIDATDIFETEWCEIEDDGFGNYQCAANSQETLSVFDDIFSEYFWEVNNHGVRLIQLRFYLRNLTS